MLCITVSPGYALEGSNVSTMAANYSRGNSSFSLRFVRNPIVMGQTMHYTLYGGGMYSGPPNQKAFRFTYTFEPPSQLSVEVTHQAENLVIYMRKYNHFMSLMMEEMCDLSVNIKNMLSKMELCKGVLMGTTEFYLRSKKDTMMMAKRSARAKKLEREQEMKMFYPPSLNRKRNVQPDLSVAGVEERRRKMVHMKKQEEKFRRKRIWKKKKKRK